MLGQERPVRYRGRFSSLGSPRATLLFPESPRCGIRLNLEDLRKYLLWKEKVFSDENSGEIYS